MTIKNQFKTIKDNWLLILVVIVIFVFFSNGTSYISSPLDFENVYSGYGGEQSIYSKEISPSYSNSLDSSFNSISSIRAVVMGENGVSSELGQRKITKTSSLSTEVEKGEFYSAEKRLKDIISSSGAFILNENVYSSGNEWKQYKSGSYSLKIEVSKYDSFILQLKEIGEITSFNENSQDITERYSDLSVELEVEKERLNRYNEMYSNARQIEDKIMLNDRIFNQERRIKYIEQSLENIDESVDYSTIYVSLQEKPSEYANIVFVKVPKLILEFVRALNDVLLLIFWIIPYSILAGLIWFIWRIIKKRI